MIRGFYNFILQLVDKVESLLIRGTIALIILLITVQITLSDPLHSNLDLASQLSVDHLQHLPVISQLLDFSSKTTQRSEGTSSSQESSQSVVGEVAGRVELKILNSNVDNLEQIKIFVNDQFRTSFSDEQLKLEVRPGDKIMLDTRNIEQGLWFQVTALSANIQNFKQEEQFWVQNDLYLLPEIKVSKRY
ncbi:MAG: hypothetical protein ACQEQI_02760 [Bacillota bacterium]